MLSFLPKTYKKDLIQEYRFRLATIVLFFVSLLLVIALVGLLPTYLNEKAQADVLRSRVTEQKETPEEQELFARNEANKVLVEYLAKEIKMTSSQIKISAVIDTILSKKPETISLRGMRFVEKGISISGIADTRNDLIMFEKNLETNALFANVNLPIGDITKNVDAPFTIDITLK